MSLTLSPSPFSSGVPGPLVLVVMDGVGLGRGDEGDAVALARTPVLDALRAQGGGRFRSLRAHGRAVGLPSDADMGNSEVGHNAIGAGRVFDQGAKRVQDALGSGELFRGEVWRGLTARCQRGGGTLHLLGLLSDGNVHSHIAHLLALLEGAHRDGVEKVRVHVLFDGRDVPETSGLLYVDTLEACLHRMQEGGRDYRAASAGGRMLITMDRYGADWGMVKRGWDTHVRGEGRRFSSLREGLLTLRGEVPGLSDQWVPPYVVASSGEPVGVMRDGDAVVLFNFRGDRAVEISRAFEEKTFTEFDRGAPLDVLYAGMMQYDGDTQLPQRFLVSPPAIDHTLSQHLSEMRVPQLACSETQKFGHVTYFWNGNNSGAFPGETFVEIPSDSLPFEERPWMKAAEVTDRVIAELQTGRHRFARLNYANGDMVGHTGHREAAILAVEAVDLCLGRILSAVRTLGGAALVTADHGNADDMVERDGQGNLIWEKERERWRPKTSHSLHPVPCALVVPPGSKAHFREDLPLAGLANLAATSLELLGFTPPTEYQDSLLRWGG